MDYAQTASICGETRTVQHNGGAQILELFAQHVVLRVVQDGLTHPVALVCQDESDLVLAERGNRAAAHMDTW